MSLNSPALSRRPGGGGMMKIKRIYEKPEKTDGYRVLVDRLWPRGISKDSAKLDLWLKEIAPSDEARKWFGHDEARWEGFRKRYLKELAAIPETVGRLKAICGKGTVTLLYAAKNQEQNNAVVLRDLLGK